MTNAELQKNRFLAALIDFVGAAVLYAVFMVIGMIFSMIHPAVGGLVNVIAAAGLACFFLGRDILFSGNSIGKKLMKIKVVSSDGRPIDMTQSAKRNFVFAIPYLLILLQSLISFLGALFPSLLACATGVVNLLIWLLQILVSFAVLGFIIWEIITITKDPDGIRWGDKFAGTRVESLGVSASPAAPVQTPPQAPTPPPPPPPPAQ